MNITWRIVHAVEDKNAFVIALWRKHKLKYFIVLFNEKMLLSPCLALKGKKNINNNNNKSRFMMREYRSMTWIFWLGHTASGNLTRKIFLCRQVSVSESVSPCWDIRVGRSQAVVKVDRNVTFMNALVFLQVRQQRRGGGYIWRFREWL